MSKMVVPAPRYESVMDLIEESGMRSVAGEKPVVFLTPARIVDTARASKVKWISRPKTILN